VSPLALFICSQGCLLFWEAVHFCFLTHFPQVRKLFRDFEGNFSTKRKMVSFGDTLLAAVQGVVRVLLVVFTGAVIQTKGILPASLRLGLSQLVFRLFLPCLLFTSIVKALSISSLASLAGVFAFAVGAHFTGAAVGWASHALFVRVAPSRFHSPVLQAPLFAACVALGNHGYLPLSLLPTVLGLLPFGNQRDAEEDSADAVAITAMYIMCLNLLSWTFIHGLIRRQKRDTLGLLGLQVAREAPKAPSPAQGLLPSAMAFVRKVLNPPLIACLCGVIIGLAAPLKAVLFAEIDENASCEDDVPVAPLGPTLTGALLSLADCTVPIVLLQLGATMTDMYTSSRQQKAVASCAGVADTAQGPSAVKPQGQGAHDNTDTRDEVAGIHCAGIETDLPAVLSGSQVATPPSAGVQVAPTAVPAAYDTGPAAQAADGALEACSDEPLQEQDGSAAAQVPLPGGGSSALLDAAPPASNEQGGSSDNLHALDRSGNDKQDGHFVRSSPPAALAVDVSLATVSWPLLASVLAARLVVMPALGTALVYALVQAGVLPSDDPVLVFVVMMQFTPPPAMNLALIGELEEFAQAALGQVLFVGHVTAAISMTAWISLQLAIVNSIIQT